ncbi:NfeD family protein [Paraferrimonas sedimenticola]|uniref:NfeD-like C-terminal domain-containing protein n=1 Tax=Paraferrimonas sedimenticola TaxID=375674 RepID=A0AA37W0S7_9GAMM|nr:NfeD family protein [Paraferrimonas sedimenticola]GLP95893.1 hypothetical protein GCM10007895_11990 [Paraferrimonas sedimenticola]
MWQNPSVVWVVAGILMMLAELLIPGGVVFFLGLSALLVGGMIGLGLITSWTIAFTLWFILSIVLTLSLRQMVQKHFGGDISHQNTDEELSLSGQSAEVIEAIGPGQVQGRVRFQGTTWTAVSDGREIEVGQEVVIICRENIGLLVEPKA